MTTIRVAMCQITCLDGDRRGNLARAENAICEAGKAGADLACLPEMVIYGWVNPDAHRRAHPIPGEDADRLCELAQRYGLFLCAGLAEKDGTRLHDTAILIGGDGQIRLKHRKIHLLTQLMTPAYTPGREVNVTKTKFGTIGVLICADTHVRPILERMARLKPALVLVPYGYAAEEAAWPGHGTELERVVTETATITGAPVVGTNLIGRITHGPWAGRTYAGHSVAADASGRILAVGADFDTDIRLVTVSLARGS